MFFIIDDLRVIKHYEGNILDTFAVNLGEILGINLLGTDGNYSNDEEKKNINLKIFN